MSEQIVKPVDRLIRIALIALVIVLAGQVRRGQARPQSAMQPMVLSQVFDVSCISTPAISPTYVKLADLATFSVQSPDSSVEVTYNGRIFVGSFSSGTGAVFELRVDDTPSTAGRARANLRAAEAGGGGIQASITGFFSGMAAGDHTASMWVRTSTGGAGTQAMVDPGCWSTDVLIVEEHLPFGFTYLPTLVSP